MSEGEVPSDVAIAASQTSEERARDIFSKLKQQADELHVPQKKIQKIEVTNETGEIVGKEEKSQSTESNNSKESENKNIKFETLTEQTITANDIAALDAFAAREEAIAMKFREELRAKREDVVTNSRYNRLINGVWRHNQAVDSIRNALNPKVENRTLQQGEKEHLLVTLARDNSGNVVGYKTLNYGDQSGTFTDSIGTARGVGAELKLGEKLLEEFVKEAGAHGITKFDAHVWPGSRQLYERFAANHNLELKDLGDNNLQIEVPSQFKISESSKHVPTKDITEKNNTDRVTFTDKDADIVEKFKAAGCEMKDADILAIVNQMAQGARDVDAYANLPSDNPIKFRIKTDLTSTEDRLGGFPTPSYNRKEGEISVPVKLLDILSRVSKGQPLNEVQISYQGARFTITEWARDAGRHERTHHLQTQRIEGFKEEFDAQNYKKLTREEYELDAYEVKARDTVRTIRRQNGEGDPYALYEQNLQSKYPELYGKTALEIIEARTKKEEGGKTEPRPNDELLGKLLNENVQTVPHTPESSPVDDLVIIRARASELLDRAAERAILEARNIPFHELPPLLQQAFIQAINVSGREFNPSQAWDSLLNKRIGILDREQAQERSGKPKTEEPNVINDWVKQKAQQAKDVAGRAAKATVEGTKKYLRNAGSDFINVSLPSLKEGLEGLPFQTLNAVTMPAQLAMSAANAAVNAGERHVAKNRERQAARQAQSEWDEEMRKAGLKVSDDTLFDVPSPSVPDANQANAPKEPGWLTKDNSEKWRAQEVAKEARKAERQRQQDEINKEIDAGKKARQVDRNRLLDEQIANAQEAKQEKQEADQKKWEEEAYKPWKESRDVKSAPFAMPTPTPTEAPLEPQVPQKKSREVVIPSVEEPQPKAPEKPIVERNAPVAGEGDTEIGNWGEQMDREQQNTSQRDTRLIRTTPNPSREERASDRGYDAPDGDYPPDIISDRGNRPAATGATQRLEPTNLGNISAVPQTTSPEPATGGTTRLPNIKYDIQTRVPFDTSTPEGFLKDQLQNSARRNT